jgi:hypothetical protein
LALKTGPMTTCALRMRLPERYLSLYCWGDNARRQVGRSLKVLKEPALVLEGDDLTAQIVVESTFACFLDASQRLWCAGLGAPSSEANRGRFLPVDLPVAPAFLTSSPNRICLLSNHSVDSPPYNASLCLFKGQREPLIILNRNGDLMSSWAKDGEVAPVLVQGQSHTCYVADGVVRCFGANDFGQTGSRGGGFGPKEAPLVGIKPDVTHMVAGSDHTCVAYPGGQVNCWGRNDSGQCGTTQTDKALLRPSTFNLRGAVRDMAAGASHTCAIVSDASAESTSLWCWGTPKDGQLGPSFSGDRPVEPQPIRLETLRQTQ